MNHDDRDRYKHAEPGKTKIRTSDVSTQQARAWLDKGGHWEAPEEALYRHMRESQRRLMCMLPTMLWVGVTHLRENLGYDISEDLQIALERAAGISVKYLVPHTAEETITTILRDSERVIIEMSGSDAAQAVTGVAHLITAIADQGRIPDPTSQSVLTSLAILTEAENDMQAGLRGTWSYDEAKLQMMANRGIKKLEFMGYL